MIKLFLVSFPFFFFYVATEIFKVAFVGCIVLLLEDAAPKKVPRSNPQRKDGSGTGRPLWCWSHGLECRRMRAS